MSIFGQQKRTMLESELCDVFKIFLRFSEDFGHLSLIFLPLGHKAYGPPKVNPSFLFILQGAYCIGFAPENLKP